MGTVRGKMKKDGDDQLGAEQFDQLELIANEITADRKNCHMRHQTREEL